MLKTRPRTKLLAAFAVVFTICAVAIHRDAPFMVVETFYTPDAGTDPSDEERIVRDTIVPRHALKAYVEESLRQDRRPFRITVCPLRLAHDRYGTPHETCYQEFSEGLFPEEMPVR